MTKLITKTKIKQIFSRVEVEEKAIKNNSFVRYNTLPRFKAHRSLNIFSKKSISLIGENILGFRVFSFWLNWRAWDGQIIHRHLLQPRVFGCIFPKQKYWEIRKSSISKVVIDWLKLTHGNCHTWLSVLIVYFLTEEAVVFSIVLCSAV